MFFAEDVPWYMVDSGAERPWRDEDLGMSAPVVVARDCETVAEAREALSSHLKTISQYEYVINGGEFDKYTAAAMAVLFGVDGVRIFGRYYRVREA